MKNYTLLLLLLFLNCKEKTSFADKIQLDYPKDEKLTFQEFNEGVGETGTSILYIGDEKEVIPVKYYKSTQIEILTPFIKDSTEIKRDKMLESYFYEKFNRKIGYSDQNNNVLNNNNLFIKKNINDTIPRYDYDVMNGKIKKYKAFPVFIKNIAGKNIEITEFSELNLKYKISDKEWKNIYNHNYYICGTGLTTNSWTLQKEEILIASINFLKGNDEGSFKVCLGEACSEPFMMKFDKKIVELQR